MTATTMEPGAIEPNRQGRFVLALIASAAFHVGTAFLLIAIPHTPEQAAPTRVEFEVRRPPPPPVAEPKPKAKPRPAPRKAAVAAPREPVPTQSDAAASPAAQPVFGLSAKSFKLGGRFAVRAGNTIEMEPADKIVPPDQVQKLKPVTLARVTTMPRIRRAPEPQYPESMRADGREATVVLEIVIDDTGKVQQVEVIQSAGEAFDRAARESILKTEFEPATEGDRPIPVRIKIPVKFRLRD